MARSAKKKSKSSQRVLNARPDTVDFRDEMFVPTLVEVPIERPLKAYLDEYRRKVRKPVPILDQGQEGACTGFGLAAVCNYLLGTRSLGARHEIVSARMAYEMARRYDEWRGEDYDGSSARGAMKGWHRHGVCSEKAWPYETAGAPDAEITDARAKDAALRPLGAYFRVNHRDLVAMHAAISEVGILYATASVHDGWDEVDEKTGIIPYRPGVSGGHAFAIVAFDQFGFWVQNSWGKDWGLTGFARVSYEDWLANGYDVWVARLGAPICLDGKLNLGVKQGGMRTAQFSFQELRRHIISIGNDGRLRSSGTYGTTPTDVQELFANVIPAVTKNWKTRRILLYAHGGLVPEENAIQRVQDYLEPLLAAEVYPIAFIWKTDFWTTLKNLLEDCVRRRRTAEPVGGAKDFLLDRLDDTLERLARLLQGDRIWGEMKENAACASMRTDGGARLVADGLAALAGQQAKAQKAMEIHVAGHSAGSIFMGPVIQRLTSQGALPPLSLLSETGIRWDEPTAGLGLTVKSVTLWAAACTTGLFKATYLPALESGAVKKLTLFNLSDAAEQSDHCAHIYHKSLLYLVSHAFEAKPRKFLARDGWPILGMDKFIRKDPALAKLIEGGPMEYVIAPNPLPAGDAGASGSTAHGAFDDDKATIKATLARIRGVGASKVEVNFSRSARSAGERRRSVLARTRD